MALFGAPAAALTTVWKQGAKPASVDTERAVLAYDRNTRLENLVLEVTLAAPSAGALVVVATPGRPTPGAAPAEVFDQIERIRSDAGAPDAASAKGTPPKVTKIFSAADGKAIEGWLGEAGLAVATKFDGWRSRLDEGAFLSFVEVPENEKTLRARLVFKASTPRYPYSAPLIAGARWPTLDLYVVSETPVRWTAPAPSPLTVDIELSGATVTARLDRTVRSALGFDQTPSTLWVGRYEVKRSDRSSVKDASFTVSARRRADEKVQLVGPPFGSARPPASAPSARAEPSAQPLTGEQRGPTARGKKRRTRWGRSTMGGMAILVLGIGAALWAIYKRRSGG